MVKKRIKALLLFLMTTILAGCGGKVNTTKNEIRALYGENRKISGDYDRNLAVRCNNGTFVGRDENGVISFKGIPYAEQPVGSLRWKAPQPAEDRAGVYEAYYYGKTPIQTEWPSEVGSYYPQGEDCLNLNIWVNPKNTSKNKTVMVFFHGGSYGWGATSDPLYEGHNLVEKFDDIILVTVEYRVGMMGFIDLSSVKGGEEYAESGNLGLLDQVESLRWIRKNIEKFGGNPENVTIFGESAGGGSVSLLPLIDGTEGLFNRVIAQSGSVALTYSKEECRNLTDLILEETGCSSMDELTSLSEKEIVALNEKVGDNNNFPERDGVVLPVDLYGAYAEGRTKNIDLMIGTNADEMRYWINEMGYYTNIVSDKLIYSVGMSVLYENNISEISPEDMKNVNSFMKLQTDRKTWNLTEFYNELLFRVPALEQAKLHAENGGKSYVYYWSYPGEDEIIGACHAIELSSVFNNLDETIYTGNKVNPELADAAQNMWVNFARTGDPSIKSIHWDTYTEENRNTIMVLDSEIRQVNDLHAEQRELIEPLLKYGFNGCRDGLSFGVPTVFKVGAAAIIGLAVMLSASVGLVHIGKKIFKK